jgi:uncharacterized protein (DUF885 family)
VKIKTYPKLENLPAIPFFLKAGHAESLGEELDCTPILIVTAYKSELFRSIRLVTDVGLHTGKITREESIQYMMEKEEENNKLQFQKQKDIWPGRAKHFLIKTELKITELKAKYIKEWAPSLKSKNFMTPFYKLGPCR